jgi:proteasome lid subunit RPN8/RPN11
MTKYEPSAAEWAAVRRDLGVLAGLEYPREACGFDYLLDEDQPAGSGLICEAVANIDSWPFARFKIAEEDTRRALATRRLVGVWHSHPADPAVPSEVDTESAPHGIFYVIYAVQDEDLAVFLQEEGQLVPQTIVMPGPDEAALDIQVRG